MCAQPTKTTGKPGSSGGKPTLTITASNASMTYGGTVPSITPSYAGFVNGDTPASLTTPPTCTTTATGSSSPGTYASTCSGAVDNNYTMSYVAGTVTVNQPTSITLDPPADIAYGATVTLTAHVSGSGTVTFLDFNGNVTLGTGTLSNGIATFSINTLAPGSHLITATYNGATSNTVTPTVRRNTMTLPSYCNGLHQ